MWPVLNSGPCRTQNRVVALRPTGASGREAITGTGLPCPAWQLLSLGQETAERPGTSPGPIALCLS